MTIKINSVKNTMLREIAIENDVDNSGTINGKELQEIISGVAKVQENRNDQILRLGAEKAKAKKESHKQGDLLFWGSLVTTLGSGFVLTKGRKYLKLGALGMLAGIGMGIYAQIKSNKPINEYEERCKKLEDSTEVQAMANELKMIIQKECKSQSNEDIVNYLDKMDGRKNYKIAGEIWNNYRSAIYGAEETATNIFTKVQNFIHSSDAIEILNEHDKNK